MTVTEVMTPFVHTIHPGASLEKAIRIMNQQRVHALPVVEHGELVGIITRNDIMHPPSGKTPALDAVIVENIMTLPVITCTESDSIPRIMQIMETRKIHRLPVVNQEQKLVGIITLTDARSPLPHPNPVNESPSPEAA